MLLLKTAVIFYYSHQMFLLYEKNRVVVHVWSCCFTERIVLLYTYMVLFLYTADLVVE